jgi:4-amino-4-deoxy-L-arabinose transferase-like glycosyltransferase
MESNSIPSRFARRQDLTLIAVLAAFVLLQLPFLTGAFRIDDTNILAIAKQIARAPLDPYGFTFNWTGASRPAFDILANPPLAPALLAMWAAVFGWSEISLHLLTLLFALAAIAALFSIRRDVVAAALLASSPAFFVSTQTVMPDMLMLALLLIAVAAAIHNRPALAFVAGFLIPIAKYNGIIAVAILATIAILSKERRRSLTAVALSPIAGLLAWNLYSLWQYGAMHLLVVSEERRYNLAHTFADLAVEGKRMAAIDPFISVVVLAGLAVIPLGWQLLMRRRIEWLFALAALVAAFGVARWALASSISASILFAIGVAAGIRAIAFVIASRNPVAIVWLIAIIGFQAITFAVATRYLLPLLPAVLLIVPEVRRGLAIGAIALSLAVTIPVAIGELAAANCYRDFVAQLPRRPFYFAGHWGFQYYASAHGGTLIDVRQPPVYRPGDIIVIASHAFPSPGPMNFPHGARKAYMMFHSAFPLHTIACDVPASYNVGEISGCRSSEIFLPFGFSSEPLEEFDVFVVQ